MPTPPPTETALPARPLPVWQRTLARVSPIAAGFTTLCCLGLPALVAFASSIGATFLTDDAALRPLLAATLLLTLIGSALTYRSHRNPAPLITTAIAAVMIYWPLYGPPSDTTPNTTRRGTRATGPACGSSPGPSCSSPRKPSTSGGCVDGASATPPPEPTSP